MAERGERERIELVLLAAGVAAGAALSLTGALAGMLAPVSGLSAPGTGGVLRPWSPVLAALCAWAGGYGWVAFERRGWNPALRAVEGVAVVAIAALGIALSGGYSLPGGTPPWAPALTSLPAVAGLFAWGLAARLAGPLWSGRVNAKRKAPAKGAPPPAANPGSFEAWQEVYLFVRNHLLALPAAVAAAWAGAALAVRDDPESNAAVLLIGAAVMAGCGLSLLARVHQRLIALEFERGGARVEPGLERGAGGLSLGLSLAAVVLGLLLPANLSPLRAWHFNSWMERLTERLGPLFVPSQAPTRKVGEGLGRFSIDRLFAELAERSAPGGGAGGSLLLWVAVLAGVLFAAWRVFRSGSRSARPVRMGRLPLGLGWLYEQIRAAIVRWFARWGWVRRGPESGPGAGAEDHAPASGRKARRGGWRSVTAVYVDVIGRLGRRGLVRREAETPLEFLERWRTAANIGDDAALELLTDLYLAERYGGRRPTSEVIAEARRSGARAIRAIARFGGVMRLRGRRRR